MTVNLPLVLAFKALLSLRMALYCSRARWGSNVGLGTLKLAEFGTSLHGKVVKI